MSAVEGGCLVEHRRHPVRADEIEHLRRCYPVLAVNKRITRKYCSIGDEFGVEHRRQPVRADQTEHFIKVVLRFGIQQKGCKKALQYWLSSLFRLSRQTLLSQRGSSRKSSRDIVAENPNTSLNDLLVVQKINIDQKALFEKRPVLKSQQTQLED